MDQLASKRDGLPHRGQPRGGARERQFGIAGLLPAYLLVAIIVFLPLLVAFYTSWFAWDLRVSLYPSQFVGLRNFLRVFTDPVSRQFLTNTAVLVVASVGGTMVLGLGAALLLSNDFVGRGLARSLLLLPWAVPGIAAATMWWWMYSARFGMLNYVLESLGVIQQPVSWLLDYPMFSLIMANVWKEMPFSALLFLAGLQGIGPELYEAAMVDGANSVQRFLFVTMPLLRNVIVVVMIFQTAASLKMFDMIFTLTLGGPYGQTTTLGYWAYVTSFRYWDFGFGTAIAFTTAGLVLLFSAVYITTTYRAIET